MKKLFLFSMLFWSIAPAHAVIGESPEFRLDLRGLGPWQRHTARASEPLAYSSAWATNAAAGAKAVVKVMPVLKTKPKYLVIDLSGGTNATHYPISSLDEVPGGSWSDEYKTSKLVLRHIPAGSFIMGGRATDYPGAVNTNLHMVTITRDFYMGVFEVTQRQWELVMGTRPSSFTNEAAYAMRPVETVNFALIRGMDKGLEWPLGKDVDDGSFIGVMRQRARLCGLDLPTEAQWEYAARAGTTTALYSGRNFSWDEGFWEGIDAVLGSLAQYQYNSGWTALGTDRQLEIVTNPAPISVLWPEVNTSSVLGTRAVGSFLPNDFGLYDLYGNVGEYCLDRYQNGRVDSSSIDPKGIPDGNGLKGDRSLRGAGIVSDIQCCSSHRGFSNVSGKRNFDRGFRLCLQGGDVPDFAAASTLVNESGTGSQSWAPTRSGTYYLTHSTMNGEANAQLMSAWFEVPGCELTLEPQGELTNGVSVAITGAGEGWTVYYTTNGLAPSEASEKYTGPFSLPESATVRAVAYNTQGVTSEETTTSFTLHDALSVVGAVARPRYPWNGLVDVDCEIKGDEESKYEVEVEVRDLEGGTNLTVRTVYVDATSSSRQDKDGSNSIRRDEDVASTLAPGRHRLTWNADADIAHDHEFPRVAVTVKATKQSVLAGYARQFAISTDGYAGEETLMGVPVLVRLSTAIDGFDYRDFASPTNGADLAFFDANEQALPYEIDEWHTNGESLVWVKLPELAKGTRFTCAYGAHVDATSSSRQNEEGSSSNRRDGDVASTKMKHEVWREYAGVWHMNEDSGTAFDSTEHGLDALPSCGTNTLADISQMVAYENGACGRARVNAVDKYWCGTCMQVPSYDGLSLGGDFVISGWFMSSDAKGTTRSTMPKLFSRKNDAGARGWDVLLGEKYAEVMVRGKGLNHIVADIPSAVANWVNLTVDYSEGNIACYTNGVLTVAGAILPVEDNGLILAFGNEARGSGVAYSFNGQYDEIRLRGGSLSADRIKADYDMIAKRDFCTYGVVKNCPGANPIKVVTITFDPTGGTLTGAVSRVYKGDYATYGALSVPTKTGQIFAGWSLTAGGVVKLASTDLVPASNTVIYATWIPVTYSVKFNANGGTGTMANESFTYGVEKALTANAFTRTGYTFSGWATSSSGTKVYSDMQSVSNLAIAQGALVDLYAVWNTALYMVVDLSGGSSAASYPVTYLNAVPSGGWSDAYKTTKLLLRRIEPGSFSMGDIVRGTEWKNVSLSKPYYIGVFELTQRQWELAMGTRPSTNTSGYEKKPVETIVYDDIRGSKTSSSVLWPKTSNVGSSSFMGLLRTRTGLAFDLPAEVQWEYACRATTRTDFNNGSNMTYRDDTKCAGLADVGWYFYNTDHVGKNGTQTVGSLKCNSWGLYDMHGNVYEYCLDPFGGGFSTDANPSGKTDPIGPIGNGIGSGVVIRGGSYDALAYACPSYERTYVHRDKSSVATYAENITRCGFRVCLTVNQ